MILRKEYNETMNITKFASYDQIIHEALSIYTNLIEDGSFGFVYDKRQILQKPDVKEESKKILDLIDEYAPITDEEIAKMSYNEVMHHEDEVMTTWLRLEEEGLLNRPDEE